MKYERKTINVKLSKRFIEQREKQRDGLKYENKHKRVRTHVSLIVSFFFRFRRYWICFWMRSSLQTLSEVSRLFEWCLYGRINYIAHLSTLFEYKIRLRFFYFSKIKCWCSFLVCLIYPLGISSFHHYRFNIRRIETNLRKISCELEFIIERIKGRCIYKYFGFNELWRM